MDFPYFNTYRCAIISSSVSTNKQEQPEQGDNPSNHQGTPQQVGTTSSSSMESLDDSANANSNEDEDNDDENQKSLTIFVGEEKVNFPVKPDSVITFESVRENLLSDPIWNFSEDKLSKIRKEKY